MDVVTWQDSPPPASARKRNPRRFLSPTFIGILGTLLLHTLAIRSVSLWGRGTRARPPEIQDSADAFSKSMIDSSEGLLLISLPGVTDSSQISPQNLISSLPDLRKIKITSPVEAEASAFLNIESLALSEDQASRPTSGSGDGAEQARLFGIYTGQILARIDRVWRRPRTPVNDDTPATNTIDVGDSFQCDAQIIQDAKGNVQEILLPRCNGSPAWQRSLVLAIQQASPLPAPPSAKVFAPSVSLHFAGFEFVAGSTEDGYESEYREVARSE